LSGTAGSQLHRNASAGGKLPTGRRAQKRLCVAKIATPAGSTFTLKSEGRDALPILCRGSLLVTSASARRAPRKKARRARKVHRRTTGLQRSARGKNGEETPASAAARNTLDKTSQTSLQGPVRARATKERCRWFHVRVQGCIHGRASCAAGGARAPCPTQIAVRGPERPGIRRFESPRRACAAVEHLDSAHQPVRAASVLGRVSDAALFGT